jgi:acetyl esterase/lipase
MRAERIYDQTIQVIAAVQPRLDTSDPDGAWRGMAAILERLAAAGFERSSDEGILYAMPLMAAGVPVGLHHYPGTVHGFDFMTPSEISTRAVNEGVEAFQRAMAR